MKRPVLELGLVMAGAVSAGAYTAGVLDFLLEALGAFEAEKRARKPETPDHETRIRVVAGTSAGGINAAILATALDSQIAPVCAPPPPKGSPPTNPFYASWVEGIDIAALLGMTDIGADGGGRVLSLFDSSVLDTIADRAFAAPGGALLPPFIADPLDILLTVTNLRGTPYNIDLIGGALGRDVPAGYEMIAHADYVRFAIGERAGTEAAALAPGTRTGAGWTLLRDAALATAAFPGAFRPRPIVRPAGDYTRRQWRVPRPAGLEGNGEPCSTLEIIAPSWQLPPQAPIELLCVDGGVLNNEPLELARRVLEESPSEAGYALVLIDPFPRTGRFDPAADIPGGFAGLMLSLLGTLRAQAGFKPEELVLALGRQDRTRFLIAPRRTASSGDLLPHPLAGGAIEGFAGFLDKRFRTHDFFLGRRNCQRFLARHLALPHDHPLVTGWTPAMDQRFGIWPKGVARTGPAPLRPIIPLVGSAAAECPDPVWPALSERDLSRIERLLKRRLSAVIAGLSREYFSQGLLGGLAPLLVRAQRGRAAREMIAYIRQQLAMRGQIAAPKRRGLFS